MAGITLTEAEEQLAAWRAASLKVSQRQSYEIAGRRLTYADSDKILEQILFWNRMVKELSQSASSIGRSRTLSPRW